MKILLVSIQFLIATLLIGQGGYNEPQLPTQNQTSNSKIIVDLSESPGKYTKPISVGQARTIEIQNRILTNPNLSYSIDISVSSKLISSFQTELEGFSEFLNANLAESDTLDCESLKLWNTKFDTISSEKDLPKLIMAAEYIATESTNKVDTSGCMELTNLLNNIAYNKNVFKQTVLSISKGQVLTIKITRTGNNETKVWEYIYEAPERGRWITSYGFNYVSYLFSKPDNYFLKQVDTTFQITEGTTRDWFDVNPTVMFSWLSSNNELSNWNFSLTGGLGLNIQDPSVLIGAGLLYNQNIGINIGITGHRLQKLHSKYTPDEIIKENLEPDQLHQNVLRVNPYINFSFRFSENPFKKKESESKGEDEK